METPPADSVLSLVAISKTYDGARKPALDDVSFAVKPGEFFSILGRSEGDNTRFLLPVAGF